MSKVLDRLNTDHRRLHNILAATQKIAEEYRIDNTDSLSDHLFCLIDYLSGYPDKVHHPTEDLVFDKLLDLDLTKEQIDKVQHNRSQHRNLTSATHELKHRFDSFAGALDIDQFLVVLDEYSQQQHRHMKFEEQEIFPLALEYFTSATWEELDKRFGETKDPLFDEADSTYAALYKHIVVDPDDPEAATVSDALLRYLNATALGQSRY